MENQQPKAQTLFRKILPDVCVLLISTTLGIGCANLLPVSFKAFLAWSVFLTAVFMLTAFALIDDISGNGGGKRNSADSGGGGWFGESCGGGDGGGGDGGGGGGGGGD